MDIYTLIHNDHESAKEVIEQILSSSSHANRLSLFEKLKEAVVSHNDAEASSFYVALEAHSATRALARDSRKEHDKADAMFKDLSDKSMAPGVWESKFEELRKALMEHIDKEEGEVFTLARKTLSAQMAKELAVAMQQLKQMRKQLLRQAS
jgi:hemerythrin-like domain-containing protein